MVAIHVILKKSKDRSSAGGTGSSSMAMRVSEGVRGSWSSGGGRSSSAGRFLISALQMSH